MPTVIQRSFTSGEISPSLRSRADLIKYATGLALCENMMVRPQGGVYSRPGFKFITELADSTKKARLIPFSFNTEQTYVLVFEHLIMRVIKAGAVVLDGGVPFSLVTPYTESELPRLSFTQSADILTIVHPNHDPADLGRLADDSWTLTDIDFSPTVQPPVFNQSTTVVITGITQANPAVVTTGTDNTFAEDDEITIDSVVGMTEVNNRLFSVNPLTETTFELIGEDSTGYSAYVSGGNASRANGASTVGGVGGAGDKPKTYEYVVTAVDVDGVESVHSSPASIRVKSLTTTYGVLLKWDEVDNVEYYRLYKATSEKSGVYGWIGDSNSLQFSDYNTAPLTSDSPPNYRHPFTGSDNSPSAVNYYQQRKIFANTTNEPQAVFTTQTGDYRSLRTSSPARDDDAITFTIVGQEVNEIRHILTLDSLVLLTSGGEWLVSEGQDRVLTPSTVGVRIQSYNGSSWVPPVVINSTVLYVQEKGARIRDLGYEFSSDKYTGNDLSLMSEHLFDGSEVVAMAYAAEPDSILWCVMDDGRLLGLTYQREHEVFGWHHHSTEGFFEDITSVGEEGRDAIYVTVRRTVNGTEVRYVERLEARHTKSSWDAFCVDSGLSLDSPSTISGATLTSPVVISDVAHGYSNAGLVDIDDVAGMTELNGVQYKVANVTSNTYELTDPYDDSDIDGTGFTEYVSGGKSRAAVTAITGLSHLEGEAVAVMANGNEVTGLTVSSGAITLPEPASRVHVGLAYLPVIELLDIDVGAATESLKSLSVAVSKVTLELQDSRGGFIGPTRDDGAAASMVAIKPRTVADSYDALALHTYKAEVFIEPQWSKGGGVRIEQRNPLPLAVLSVIPDVSVGG